MPLLPQSIARQRPVLRALRAARSSGRAYHISALPVTVFIDRAGLIRAILIGQQQKQDFNDQADELL